MRQARASALVVTLVLAAIAAADDTFTVPREKIMALGFKTQAVGPFTAGPAFDAPQKRWTKSIAHGDPVAGIRIHVTVASPGTSPWTLRIVDADGETVEEITSASPLVAATSFWTTEVRGQSATVELWADQTPAGASIAVDRYAYRVSPANPQGTVGDDQKQPIGDAPNDVQAWGTSVARLSIMTPLGGGFCTGFLLNDTLVMTNEHCIRDDDEAVSTTAEFGYDTAAAKPDVVRVAKLVAIDAGLDFVIVRLEKAPPPKYGRVTLDPRTIVDASTLAIVQHPEGRPKMVSLVDCTVSGLDRVGVGGDPTDFGHHCDTLQGSSGSPVFLRSSGHVVGLHHLGFPPGMSDPENQGVRLGEITTLLKTKYPNIAQELALQ